VQRQKRQKRHQQQQRSASLLCVVQLLASLVLAMAAAGEGRDGRTLSSAPLPAPVIGIFSQPLDRRWLSSNPSSELPQRRQQRAYNNGQRDGDDDDQDDSQFYIAASYVKYLEAGGARSIPIPYDAPVAIDSSNDDDANSTSSRLLLDELFDRIDGLFLPGGGADLSPAVGYMIQKAIDSNARGEYFPVWGTCLGFEFLVTYVGTGGRVVTNHTYDPVLEWDYDAENISLPLLDVVASRDGGLYGNDKGKKNSIYDIVTTKNVTMNNHRAGITPERFLANSNLTRVWRITSTNVDKKGKPFVSTIEPLSLLQFPLYGIQYHPEKNAFEYGTYPEFDNDVPYEAIDHSPEGLAFSNYMARFFVDLVRYGQRQKRIRQGPRASCQGPDRRFPVIYTYPIEVGYRFEQIHLIPPASHWAVDASTSDAAAAVKKQELRHQHHQQQLHQILRNSVYLRGKA